MDIRVTGKPGASGSFGSVEIAGTFQAQLHPSLLVSVDFPTVSAAGQSLPGGLGEIFTSKAVYLKFSPFTQMLHSTKPWVELPLSALSNASGLNLGSLINQAQTNNPLTQTQLLAGATNVRTVGNGTVDGVPVTEYTGTYSMSAALAKLPADVRGRLGQILRETGIGKVQFRVWIDGQHQVRKEIATADANAFTETATTTVTSINQPVTISLPPTSQTTTLPAGAFNNAAG